jgi:hypothetical protein
MPKYGKILIFDKSNFIESIYLWQKKYDRTYADSWFSSLINVFNNRLLRAEALTTKQ